MSERSLLDRLIFKITSGRFIFTIVVVMVYAYLATTGNMDEERINEITLIVLYAYFTKSNKDQIDQNIDQEK